MYKCPTCGNEDAIYIGIRNNHPYCRKCLSFNGKLAEKDFAVPKKSDVYLDYSLSEDQLKISDSLIANFKDGNNSFVHAVCGSGKTEIIINIINYCINNGLVVGFCVPRRDVIIELFDRFKSIFKDINITLVYGGHVGTIEGDLVCCTTHQLFRYEKYFDLLIIDEVDAFPFNGDDILNSFFFRAVRGNYIMLSATPKKEELEEFKNKGGRVYELNQRFHKYPLPVPEKKQGNIVKCYIDVYRLIIEFKKLGKQVFVFAPTIYICERLYRIISIFIKNGNYVHSKRENKEQIISDFKQGKYQYLMTTSILERGVTVKDLQVIVFLADHKIYNAQTLVQISGRVGRKKDAAEGRVIYVFRKQTKDIEESIFEIESSNKDLQNLF